MEVSRIGEYEDPTNRTKGLEGLKSGIGVIKVEVMNKPTLRYVRRVQFTKLDIIGKLSFNSTFHFVLSLFQNYNLNV